MVERAEVVAGVTDVDLGGRTALVTGATGGIGREIARALGRLGARTYVHGRDPGRGAAAVDELRAAGADAAFLDAEFADPDAVDGLAAEVRDRVDSLDLLVHNAGAYFETGRLTGAGVERTFAINQLAPYRLTRRLLPALPEGGRVVVVASGVHHGADADFGPAAVESVADYDGLEAYRRSKLANVLFAAELADRLPPERALAVASCHPGFVPGSGIWSGASLPTRAAMTLLGSLPDVLTAPTIVDTAVRAAATPVYLAAAPDAADASGGYYRDCAPDDSAPIVHDGAVRRRCWLRSAALAALDPDWP